MDVDHDLLNSLAFLDGIDRLVESKKEEYLDANRVTKILNVDYRNVETLLESQGRQASEALIYNVLAAKLNKICYDYEETVFNKYMAHCRNYACFYVEAIDAKNTKDTLKDYCIILFTKDNTSQSRSGYAKLCHDYHYEQTSGKKNLEALQGSVDSYAKALDEFANCMYTYSIRGKHYEDFIEQKSRFDCYKEKARALADAITTVGICSTNCVKLKLSGYTGEVPKVSVELVNKLRKIQQINPSISDQEVVSILNTQT